MNADKFLENYGQIMHSLHEYHELFMQIAVTGRPRLVEGLGTASVQLADDGRCLDFLFDPEFIEKLSWKEIQFVVCHEMLHILMLHGARKGRKIEDKLNHHVENAAMDLEINHNLEYGFGFNRLELDYLDSSKMGIHFVDRDFPDRDDVNTDDIFEYYWNLFKKDSKSQQAVIVQGGQGDIDDHSNLPTITDDELKDVIENATGDREVAEKLVDEINKNAGKGDASEIFKKGLAPVPKRRKWESIPGNIRSKILRKNRGPDYQWIRPDRRWSTMSSDFLLPSINQTETKVPKWDLWLFQDVSGSCSHYCEQFLNAARSIPTDSFNVRFHTFNTQVDRVDLKSGNYEIGGGTAFSPIENYIQSQIKKSGQQYPDLVWLITDGYGNGVSPEKPKNWSWFLTPGSSTSFIHHESKRYDLADFANFEEA